MAASRIAVVTGGNRGIGFEICRQLAERGIHVVLTSRDSAAGERACKTLANAGLAVDFQRLEVTDPKSVRELADELATRFGGADILVNNAGISIDPGGARIADVKLEVIRATLETNLLGPIALAQALLPFMKKRKYGRIVNISSGLGQLSDMGTGTPAYRLSKTALNAVTRMVATETRGTNVLCNSACPGWVKTDMGGPYAPRTPAEGADTPVWLATLPDGGPSGGLFRDRQPIPW